MPAEARITPVWKKQKLLLAIFLIGVGAWFIFDGKWSWPQSNERWQEHHRLESEGHLAEWPAYAQSHGWKPEPPHKFYQREDILAQYVIGTLATLAGLGILVYWLQQKGRVVRAEDGIVQTPAGIRVPLSAITGLGVKKWASKGLAKVRYELDGQQGEFVLDDYKFERDPTHAIFKEIEEHLLARTKT